MTDLFKKTFGFMKKDDVPTEKVEKTEEEKEVIFKNFGSKFNGIIDKFKNNLADKVLYKMLTKRMADEKLTYQEVVDNLKIEYAKVAEKLSETQKVKTDERLELIVENLKRYIEGKPLKK